MLFYWLMNFNISKGLCDAASVCPVGTRGSFPGVKRQKRGTGPSRLSSVEIENSWLVGTLLSTGKKLYPKRPRDRKRDGEA